MAVSIRQSIQKALKESRQIPLKDLRHLSGVDTASLLMQLPEKEAGRLFEELVQANLASSALSEMPEPHLKGFLKSLSEHKLISLFSEGQVDDLIYLMDFIEDKEWLIGRLPAKRQIKLRNFMSYPAGATGRIMQDDFFSVPILVTAGQGIEKLREYSRERFVHYVYCIDEEKTLLGVLSIRQLAIAPSHIKIKDILNQDVITVTAFDSERIAAELVDQHNFIALPVIDQDSKLLGLVTVDDVLDIIKEQAQADIYARAGLPEDDRIYSSAFSSIKNRLPWMGLNLIFAFLASSIISLFEQTMSRLIILATLKNVVAGIGGNTAIQTLTVTTRGLDTGDFGFTTFTRAILKESFVGLTIGFVMGLGAALVTFIWKNSFLVSVVIFIAMLLNSLVAVLSGFVIPVALRTIRKDPAVSSGVLVTIITDIFGFFIFLGTAHIGLKLIGESL